MLPVGAVLALQRLVHALVALLFFFLAWQMWIKARRISEYGDTTDVLRILVGPFVYFMMVMIALTACVHLFKVFVLGRRRASQATT
jgi:TRAP-type C4-dicarboxylate transport system permease small subunit